MTSIVIQNKEFIRKFKSYIDSISSESIIETNDIPQIMLFIIDTLEKMFPKQFVYSEALEELTVFLITRYCIITNDDIIKNINMILKLIDIVKNQKKINKGCL